MASKQKILIVDDEPVNIAILSGVLSDYDKMAVFDGSQVLEAATSKAPPDLILLDIMMPGMDGFAVCRQLKADERTVDIPIIFFSANSDPEDESKSFELGAADFINKSASPLVILARIKTHLSLRLAYKTLKYHNIDLML